MTDVSQPVQGTAPEAAWESGGCHCGKVRFRVRVDVRSHLLCNCSICQKKGMRGLIVEADAFELISGEGDLASYRFNTEVAVHRFCRHCGIHPFSHPRSHPAGFDVNVRCLDAWQGEDDPSWRVERFDGENWETSVDSIR